MGRSEEEFLKSTTVKVLKMIEIRNNMSKTKGESKTEKTVKSMRDFLK